MHAEAFQLPSGVTLNESWAPAAAISDIDTEIALVRQYASRLARQRNLRASLILRLPPEILHTILSEIAPCINPLISAPDSSTDVDLGRCALVCSALLPYARARFASSLAIGTAQMWARTLWIQRYMPAVWAHPRTLVIHHDLCPNPDEWRKLERATIEGTYPHHLRHLALSKTRTGERGDFDEVLRGAGALNIRRVVLCKALYGSDERSLTQAETGVIAYPDAFAHITELVLRECGFGSTETMLRMVMAFSGLKRLDLDACDFETDDGIEGHDDIPAKQLTLRHLSVAGRNYIQPYPQLVIELLRHLAPNTLRVLAYDITAMVNSGEFEQLLRLTAQNVHEIVAFWPCHGMDGSRSAPYDCCLHTLTTCLPAVRTLSIHISKSFFRRTVDILDMTRHVRLDTMNLHLDVSGETGINHGRAIPDIVRGFFASDIGKLHVVFSHNQLEVYGSDVIGPLHATRIAKYTAQRRGTTSDADFNVYVERFSITQSDSDVGAETVLTLEHTNYTEGHEHTIPLAMILERAG